jgi:hypothetical protein
MSEDLTQLSMEALQERRRQVSNDVAKFKNFQLSRKILLNSAYGALG